MSPFLHKQHERFAYLRLLLSLATASLFVNVLVLIAPLLRKRRPSKDFLFFPYTHKDNSGTVTRFQEYFPFIDNDGYTYDIHYPSLMADYDALYYAPQPSRANEYNYLRKLFWQRFHWVTKAPNYKAVFFQRQLFPEYYNQRRALLERLLHALHDNVTVDFFDSDQARNEPFFRNVIRNANKVAVVNGFLFDYFSKQHPRVLYNDLSIDMSRYEPKTEFTIGQPVRLFWTGGIENARNLQLVMPVLEEINATIPLTLVMVCKTTAGFTQGFIEHHLWSLKTFNGLLAGSDIALYPALEDNVFSRGKVAYKALEYAAAKVPMVASPQGLSSRFVHEEDVLTAINALDWKENLLRVIRDETLRQRLGESAYKKLKQYHDVNVTYKNFLEVLKA
jgi:glycosyltransferase involved in cell wall biosynthesis